MTSPSDSSLVSDTTHDRIAVLDNPVWHALGTTHRRLGRSLRSARCYEPDVTAFAAIEHNTPSAWADLAQLVGPGQMVVLARADVVEPPVGWVRLGGGFGHQMVLRHLAEPPAITGTIEPLTTEHVAQMLDLVELTKPGPFRPRTIELGQYSGIFIGDRLVAMAGERVQTPDYTEVSAVCTHPIARGRGLAAALTHHVAAGILGRGQTAVLHVAHPNVGARRVYERLGFVTRRDLEFAAFQSPVPSDDVEPDHAAAG
jgi:ribosomal protein S18 acetylase RimI-like enzyme